MHIDIELPPVQGPTVPAVSADRAHRFSKAVQRSIHLVAGIGVEGDAHAGITVQLRSRVAANPNLRQVRLLRMDARLLPKGAALRWPSPSPSRPACGGPPSGRRSIKADMTASTADPLYRDAWTFLDPVC